MTKQITKQLAQDLWDAVQHLDDEELVILKEQCHALTKSNCGWLEYNCKDIFWELADNEQKLRKNEF